MSAKAIGPVAFTLLVGAVVIALLASVTAGGVAPSSRRDTLPASSTPSPTPRAPAIRFEPPLDSLRQWPRRFVAAFTSDIDLTGVETRLGGTATGRCVATLVDPRHGRLSCEALAADAAITVSLVAHGTESDGELPLSLHTMADRLEGVRWFTEFEDPRADPVACAAASVRIVQDFVSGGSPTPSATEILARGRAFNRSGDPGLDPAAIATLLRDPVRRSFYHYYVYHDRDAATRAIVDWLLRSAKPVIAISLAGQHAPVVTGFSGTAANPSGLVVVDPQRGDVDPLTASHRPDKPRSAEYQTGRLVPRAEWDADEWWFGFAYASPIRYLGKFIDIDRSDGAYPRPHWAGNFVILVDDGDAEWPPERLGRSE